MESNFLQPVCVTGVLTWEFPQHVGLLNRAWMARIPEPLIASGLKLPSLSVRFQMFLCHVRKDREAPIRGSPPAPPPLVPTLNPVRFLLCHSAISASTQEYSIHPSGMSFPFFTWETSALPLRLHANVSLFSQEFSWTFMLG